MVSALLKDKALIQPSLGKIPPIPAGRGNISFLQWKDRH